MTSPLCTIPENPYSGIGRQDYQASDSKLSIENQYIFSYVKGGGARRRNVIWWLLPGFHGSGIMLTVQSDWPTSCAVTRSCIEQAIYARECSSNHAYTEPWKPGPKSPDFSPFLSIIVWLVWLMVRSVAPPSHFFYMGIFFCCVHYVCKLHVNIEVRVC